MEEHLSGSAHTNSGERVVVGQRLMQATPDIFLGWTRGPGGRDFYVRQLWDMKGSVDTSTLQPIGMAFYGGVCAWALARAHARSGDSVAISAYLGTQRHVRWRHRRLQRGVRRPERTGSPGLHRGHRWRAPFRPRHSEGSRERDRPGPRPSRLTSSRMAIEYRCQPIRRA